MIIIGNTVMNFLHYGNDYFLGITVIIIFWDYGSDYFGITAMIIFGVTVMIIFGMTVMVIFAITVMIISPQHVFMRF